MFFSMGYRVGLSLSIVCTWIGNCPFCCFRNPKLHTPSFHPSFSVENWEDIFCHRVVDCLDFCLTFQRLLPRSITGVFPGHLNYYFEDQPYDNGSQHAREEYIALKCVCFVYFFGLMFINETKDSKA